MILTIVVTFSALLLQHVEIQATVVSMVVRPMFKVLDYLTSALAAVVFRVPAVMEHTVVTGVVVIEEDG